MTGSVLDLIAEADRLKAAGHRDQVIGLYRDRLRHDESPLAYAAWFNFGVELAEAGDPAAAVEAYRQAIRRRPDFAPARFNLGSALERQGQAEAALAEWRAILMLDPVALAADRSLHVLTLNNLGRLLEIGHQLAEAEEFLRQSLALDPAQPDALQHWLHLRQKQCKWPLLAELPGVSADDMRRAMSALSTLAFTDDPAEQLATAQRFMARKLAAADSLPSCRRDYRHGKLRIGYLSSDFCLHPVGLLTAELFELHDRSRFAVHAFCWSREDGSSLRRRLVGAFDRHTSIAGLDDETSARYIREQEIDILVDLQGLTAGARPRILAGRPAPVQIGYLGYPGTTGHPAIDYLIADAEVLPPEYEPFYSERPLRLPGCFQASDRLREVAPTPTRADCRLPDDAFVFCSFNNNYKITPAVFAAWMRILRRVPGSVLWLLADNPWAAEHLQQEAGRHGIDGRRLVFAPRVAPPLYLARYRLADLFLDTFPFNAGTTANDALWMGLPLVTLRGRSFAARMAASLLHAAGLAELATDSLDEYEELAVRLAADRLRLLRLRQSLAAARDSSRLFDMPRFVRDLEALYVRAHADAVSSAAGRPAGGKTLLHVGCGPKDRRGTLPAFGGGEWREIRLDIDPAVRPDIVGSITDLGAVADGAVDAVFSAHNLEHLYPHEVPLALREFRRVLRDDGFAVVTCPDLQAVCALVAANRLTQPAYLSPAGPITPLDMLYGHAAALRDGRRHMAHRTGFTRDSLAAEFYAAGFATVGVVARPEHFDLWAVTSRRKLSPAELSALTHRLLADA